MISIAFAEDEQTVVKWYVHEHSCTRDDTTEHTACSWSYLKALWLFKAIKINQDGVVSVTVLYVALTLILRKRLIYS